MFQVRSVVLAVTAALVFPATPASADAAAFWGYWQAHGSSWAFAQTGPAAARPADGAVEGWRFARSNGSAGTPPRERPGFAAICGSTAPKAGSKRVAVVIDYGDAAEAPKGQRPSPARTACAVVPRNAAGSDVLAAVARPQADRSGLICAIDAFGPCGAAPARRPDTPRKKSATALTVGIGLVLVLAAAGSMAAVRRRARR